MHPSAVQINALHRDFLLEGDLTDSLAYMGGSGHNPNLP